MPTVRTTAEGCPGAGREWAWWPSAVVPSAGGPGAACGLLPRTNLTMPELALFDLSPATVGRGIQRLRSLLHIKPTISPGDAVDRLWIMDGTHIPVRDLDNAECHSVRAASHRCGRYQEAKACPLTGRWGYPQVGCRGQGTPEALLPSPGASRDVTGVTDRVLLRQALLSFVDGTSSDHCAHLPLAPDAVLSHEGTADDRSQRADGAVPASRRPSLCSRLVAGRRHAGDEPAPGLQGTHHRVRTRPVLRIHHPLPTSITEHLDQSDRPPAGTSARADRGGSAGFATLPAIAALPRAPLRHGGHRQRGPPLLGHPACRRSGPVGHRRQRRPYARPGSPTTGP